MSFIQLSQTIAKTLQDHNAVLATAESCTGGWVAEVVTMASGSSAWFDRGFVTYSNQAKQDMLGVQTATLDRHGAVSEQTAIEMADGALQNSQATVSLAITGIAGPSGGSAEKPVGLVWFAWGAKGADTYTKQQQFQGDRQSVREQAVRFALQELITGVLL